MIISCVARARLRRLNLAFWSSPIWSRPQNIGSANCGSRLDGSTKWIQIRFILDRGRLIPAVVYVGGSRWLPVSARCPNSGYGHGRFIYVIQHWPLSRPPALSLFGHYGNPPKIRRSHPPLRGVKHFSNSTNCTTKNTFWRGVKRVKRTREISSTLILKPTSDIQYRTGKFQPIFQVEDSTSYVCPHFIVHLQDLLYHFRMNVSTS